MNFIKIVFLFAMMVCSAISFTSAEPAGGILVRQPSLVVSRPVLVGRAPLLVKRPGLLI